MLNQSTLEALASESGYDDERDYAGDHDLGQCVDCERWGEHGQDIEPIPAGEYDVEWICAKCLRLRDAEARGGREPIGG